MKKIITNNKIKYTLTVLVFLFVVSCGNDEEPFVLPVSFDSTFTQISEDSASPISIKADFSNKTGFSGTITAIVSGNAEYGEDYTTDPPVLNNELTFTVAKGEASSSFSLTPINNKLSDGEKTIDFTLMVVDGIEIGSNSTTQISILDDEPPAMLLPFSESFDTCLPDTPEGWSFEHISGSEAWKCSESNAIYYIKGKSDEETESWMITPPINLGNTPSKLRFQSYALSFKPEEDREIEFVISPDFDGNVSTSSWTVLDVVWDKMIWLWDVPDSDYTHSGEVDLSEYTDIHHFAFRYKSESSEGYTEEWRIDDFNILNGIPSSMVITENISDFGIVEYQSHSEAQSFTAKGYNIEGGILITTGSHFEVSLEKDSGFTSSVTLNDITMEQIVYVRFSPNYGHWDENITLDGAVTISGLNVRRQIRVKGVQTVGD